MQPLHWQLSALCWGRCLAWTASRACIPAMRQSCWSSGSISSTSSSGAARTATKRCRCSDRCWSAVSASISLLMTRAIRFGNRNENAVRFFVPHFLYINLSNLLQNLHRGTIDLVHTVWYSADYNLVDDYHGNMIE